MATTQSQAPKSIRIVSDGIVGLHAQSRAASGKGEARRLRASGWVPAVAYGRGLSSTLLSVSPKDILAILKSERGQNSVIEMDVEAGNKLLVMIRDYSYHPVHRGLEHVDFLQVKLDQPVDVEVPLVPFGKPVGVTAGGIVRQVYRAIPVRCVPDKIPLKLEVDISHLKLNEHVSTQDLKLPPGVSVRLPPEQTIVAVVAPEKEREETPAEGAAAATPGAATAPGAAGAAAGASPEGAKDAKGGAAPAAPAKEGKKK